MGNKSILMSIRPQYVCEILNGKKTIEVRKKFPKEYVGWVYIYCTKGKPNLWLPYEYDCFELDEASQPYISNEPILDIDAKMNGKVVARFWCDKVEHFEFETISRDIDGYWWDNGKMVEHSFITKQCCLTTEDFRNYIEYGGGYAIHISKLEVFDKPKKLKEFRHTCKAEYRGYNHWQPCSKECKNCVCNQIDDEGYSQCFSRLTKAPQSWCYIEGE